PIVVLSCAHEPFSLRQATRHQLSDRLAQVARENRPHQQTVCGVVCGHTKHADVHAAETLASRLADQELAACRDRQASTALLDRRHQGWHDHRETTTGWPESHRPPRWSSTGAGEGVKCPMMFCSTIAARMPYPLYYHWLNMIHSARYVAG